ncbi:MAG: GNAT family N-acetyltransferase [Anaerolineae bacterium]
MPEIYIHPVESKKDLMRFIKFPWKVYRNDPYWVPPLISERKAFLNPAKNPFFKHSDVALFLAERGKETAGTIAAIVDHNYNEYHQEKCGWFGLFETIEDYDVAEKLLDTARQWVQERGMETLRGPVNLSTNYEYSLLVEGFDSSPVILMTYNPRYYVDFIERFGFRTARTLYAYIADWSFYGGGPHGLPQELVRVANRVRRKEGILVRNARIKDFENEIERVKKVYNSAWSKLWGFVPMTDAEFDHMASSLKAILDEDLIFVAEVDGEPVGFSLALPDLNQALRHIRDGRLFPFGIFKFLWYRRKIDTLRLFAMGIVEEYRGRGVDSLFYLETAYAIKRKGYKRVEMSLILEDNEMMNRILQRIGARIYKKYKIYELTLKEA